MLLHNVFIDHVNCCEIVCALVGLGPETSVALTEVTFDLEDLDHE